MRIATIKYDCGCKLRVIKPEQPPDSDVEQYVLLCIKHTIEVGQEIAEFHELEQLR